MLTSPNRLPPDAPPTPHDLRCAAVLLQSHQTRELCDPSAAAGMARVARFLRLSAADAAALPAAEGQRPEVPRAA